MNVCIRFIILCACSALLLASAACSQSIKQPVMSRYMGQEYLGLSAGDKSVDPDVEKSRKQVKEGMNRSSAMYRGDFADDYDETAVVVSDPLKPWNMVWFYFNDGLYRVLLRPLGQGYNYVVPQPVRQGVQNFFYNLKFPIRFVNNLLQGKVVEAGVEMSRFFGNTLFGGLGLMDITKHKKAAAETPPEDFGQTLGAWGMGEGIYLVWPVFGPSSLRDSIGQAGDYFADPISYIDPWFLNYDNPWWWTATASGTRVVTSTADRIDEYDALWEAAIDPYTAFRNAYVQNRKKEIGR